MTDKELWQAYLTEHPEQKDCSYEAWCYGSNEPDLLAALTVAGTKTATASAYPLYIYENARLPEAGDYSVILNSREEALCIIRNVAVNIIPFAEVGEEQAYKEGEGDRSLAFWRRVHKEVFTMELLEIGTAFTDTMPVVCEQFEVVFRA